MDKKYHIWTEGCQMNVADSLRVGSALEHLGYQATPLAEQADVIVLNTCVVRQSAEDKAYGRLHSLHPLKKQRPELVINLMGCLVGVKGYERLKQRFPYVDVFSPPSDPGPLVSFLTQGELREIEATETARRFKEVDAATRTCRWCWAARTPVASALSPTSAGSNEAARWAISWRRRGRWRGRG
jgi:tRNA-2-methylthio-N6-dimethylallyladenosine synthase